MRRFLLQRFPSLVTRHLIHSPTILRHPKINPHVIVPSLNRVTSRFVFFSSESRVSGSDEVVSKEELKKRIQSFLDDGDEDALPDLFEAMMKRKLSGKHDESDDEVMEEVRKYPVNDDARKLDESVSDVETDGDSSDSDDESDGLGRDSDWSDSDDEGDGDSPDSGIENDSVRNGELSDSDIEIDGLKDVDLSGLNVKIDGLKDGDLSGLSVKIDGLKAGDDLSGLGIKINGLKPDQSTDSESD